MTNANLNNCGKTDEGSTTHSKTEQLVNFVRGYTRDQWELVHAETTALNKRKQFFVAVGKELFRVGYHNFNKSDDNFVRKYEGPDLEKACEFYLRLR